MSEPVTFAMHEGVATLRLNEPATRNALSPAIRARLEELVPSAMADATVRCLLITGVGDAFCAGGDIRSFAERQAPIAVRERMARSHAWIGRLLEGEKPVVTAVNGAAVGAGFGLALLGDIVVASDTASFIGGFPLIGVAADYALGLTLPRAIGVVRAKDILMTNRRVEADEALQIGLVSRLYPAAELEGEAIRLASALARGATVGFGLTKLLVNTGFSSDVPQYLALERFAQATAFGTNDHAIGVAAYLSKTRPNFTGR